MGTVYYHFVIPPLAKLFHFSAIIYAEPRGVPFLRSSRNFNELCEIDLMMSFRVLLREITKQPNISRGQASRLASDFHSCNSPIFHHGSRFHISFVSREKFKKKLNKNSKLSYPFCESEGAFNELILSICSLPC